MGFCLGRVPLIDRQRRVRTVPLAGTGAVFASAALLPATSGTLTAAHLYLRFACVCAKPRACHVTALQPAIPVPLSRSAWLRTLALTN